MIRLPFSHNTISRDKRRKSQKDAVSVDRTHDLQIDDEVVLQSDALPAELSPLDEGCPSVIVN